MNVEPEKQAIALTYAPPIKKRKYIQKGVLALFAVTIPLLLWYTSDNGKLVDNVAFLGTPVGGLSLDEAYTKISQINEVALTNPIIFISNEQKTPITLHDLGASIALKPSIEEVYAIGKRGSVFTKASDKIQASKGVTIEPSYVWDDAKLRATLNTQLAYLTTVAEDAKYGVNLSDNTLYITPEKKGLELDIDTLVLNLKNAKKPIRSIQVPLRISHPKIIKSDLVKQNITGVLSKYSTKYNPSDTNRTENLRLAVKAIDGTLLKPGDIFSFNGVVGERTAEAGYKSAFIIMDKEFVPGLGGGICQISSTLYNAVRQTNLNITERHNHSLAVAYVPKGQDATVAYGSLDFKFKNSSDAYVLVRCNMGEGIVNFTLYGRV